MKTFAAYYDNKIRMDSSSGGIFPLIAVHFDIIYGVKMDEKNQDAVFSRNIKDISSLLGSKYIQAKVGDIYNNVRDDLLKGEKVLFSGTACQVNGLYAFLKRDYQNLFTLDVICHGVPTPKLWKKYIDCKEIKSINFRSKEKGWHNYGMKINDKYIPNNKNQYMKLFMTDLCIRPSCYECLCKRAKKSDITIGDFWGIKDIAPEMDDNRGTSIVIVRTKKGENLFNIIKNDLVWKQVSYENGIRQNPAEYTSANRPQNREDFFEDLDNLTFVELYKKYVPSISIQKKITKKFQKLFEKG